MTATHFYVYVHDQADTGRPFYVGKGCGDRMQRVRGRSAYWSRIAEKHGYRARLVAERLDEDLAFLVEVELIDKLRRMGVRLANLTSGGDGASLTQEARAKRSEACRQFDRLSRWLDLMRRPIVCGETGEAFPSLTAAVEWLRTNGHPKAVAANLSLCASGERRSAYGLTWRYAGKG